MTTRYAKEGSDAATKGWLRPHVRPRWLPLFWIATSLGLGTQAAWSQSAVKLVPEELVIPTYRTGEPEKNPIFFSGRSYQGAKGPIYPYPLWDRLTDIKEDKTYHALRFENPYVQYYVLPELGGRIFSGRDQTNGYDFIYRQHVIKPALIGMIGAWISGGVEWNIPHHHRASTFMTVDHRAVENPDGSKTIWLSEIERRHRMKWLVGLTLYPDKSYLRVTTKLFNRTPLPHTLLYFANVAVHCGPDYQVIFPPSTEYGTQHGKSEFVKWPIGGGAYGGVDRTGIDVSWWKNLPTPVSIFAWNYSDDFFGGYDHGKQAGLAILGEHHIAPGKKFFAWGNGSEGRLWDKILTDTDGPYLELMAGGYSDNQPDYSWIQPGETKVVEQYFYPLRQLGGLKKANLHAALNLDVTASGSVRLACNTTAEFRDARVILRAGERVLTDARIAISPAQPYIKELSLPAGVKAEDLRAVLSAADGRELISYQPVAAPNSPPPKRVEPPAAPKDVKTSDELYLAGLRLEQFHSPALEPYPYYEEALRRDPGDYRANVALGILYCKRALYAEAEQRLQAAIERATRNHTSPKDGEAYYYLGVTLRGQGRLDAADEAFHKAAWSSAWTAAANRALAENACRRGQFEQAREFLDRATNAGGASSPAFTLAVLRKLKRDDVALMLQVPLEFADRDPLDFWLHNERYLVRRAVNSDDAPGALDRLKTLMRGEVQSYLELAADYGKCGLYEEAIEVLERFLAQAPDKNRVDPMVQYDLGYYWEQRGDAAQALEHFRLASQLPPDYCFPFRLESNAVLRQALVRNPADARAAYYLGNLLYDLQPQAAIQAWEQSRKLDGKFATVHRNLGLAYARHERAVDKAVASLEQALACDPRDPKLYAELDTLYEAVNADPQLRLARLEQNHATVAQRDEALLREISLLILLARYDRALELLEHHHFRLWEGEAGIHDIYVDAHLLRGQKLLKEQQYAAARKDFEAALEYPEQFETAKPTRGSGKQTEVNYYLGLVAEAQQQADQARRYFEQVVQAKPDWSEARYYQALAHRKLGQTNQATELLEGLIRYGRERVQAAEELDFFAKFGTRQSPAAQQARAHWLIGLGHLGQGRKAEAQSEFTAALKSNRAHLGAKTMADALR